MFKTVTNIYTIYFIYIIYHILNSYKPIQDRLSFRGGRREFIYINQTKVYYNKRSLKSENTPDLGTLRINATTIY